MCLKSCCRQTDSADYKCCAVIEFVGSFKFRDFIKVLSMSRFKLCGTFQLHFSVLHIDPVSEQCTVSVSRF